MGSRLEFREPSKYSEKVLIGPWVYQRINALPIPEGSSDFSTTYRQDFEAKPRSKPDQSAIWDRKMDEDDSTFISDVDKSDNDYFGNYSTLYDLSYNHFPRCYKSHIPRIWKLITGEHVPLDDYLASFGNITQYGTFGRKQEQWIFEVNDPRKTASTSYNCQFQPPKKNNYDFKRFFVPKISHNDVSQDEVENFRTKRRFKAKHPVISSTTLHTYKKEYYNPITWECTRHEKEIVRKKKLKINCSLMLNIFSILNLRSYPKQRFITKYTI